jgi:hypothetical protein
VPPNLTLILSGLRFRNTSTGNNSGWQQNNNPWTSAGLTPAMAYTFVAEARNGDGDITAPSPDATVHTLANIPAVDQLIATSETEIKVVLNPNGNSAQAEYLIQNTTAGTGSGWINSTSWASEGLTCETTYNFQAKARNGDGVETIFVPLGLQSTAACGGGGVDTDSDGILDADDNCTLVANADQRDTNGDGYGNVCDADLNNDGLINFVDLGILKSVFFTADPDADLNGDGSVNFIDLGMMKAAFFGVPGPSGVL